MNKYKICPICGYAVKIEDVYCPECNWDFSTSNLPLNIVNKEETQEENKLLSQENINLNINEIWININSHCPHGVIGIEWDSNSGFGQYELVLGHDGKLHAYTEGMDSEEDKTFSKAILQELLNSIIIEG
jgi:hypothetical protein